MSIRVAPAAWGQVFALPTGVVDEHLSFVTGQQLKVLLYVLRHNGEELEVQTIADGLAMPAAEVSDAMQYWISTGFLERDDVPAAAPASPAPAKTQATEKKSQSPTKEKTELLEVPDIVPTYETVAARLLEDPSLKALFQEVQARLGKTIGYDTQAKLLMMHDTYGLPPEVILTIVEYCAGKGKGISYMCKMGKNWAEEGVLTLEDAMEKLEHLSNTDKAWSEFLSAFPGNAPRPTEQRLAFVRKWRRTFGQSPELIYYAYERTIDAIDKVNFAYTDKILTRWQEENWRTPQEVLQGEKGEAPKAGGNTGNGGAARTGKAGTSRKPRNGDNHKASYDSDAYREKAQGPIAYKRKNGQKEG